MPTDVTRPPATVATAPLLLDHAPPGVASLSVAVPPKQIVTGTGVMANGVALIVTTAVDEQVPIE